MSIIDLQTIFEKTPKGINDSKARWGIFADKRQKLLVLIDGKMNVGELLAASGMKEAQLMAELEALLQDRLIRETWAPVAEFTVNASNETRPDIYVTVANTQAYLDAVEMSKSAKTEDDEELISLDDVTEKLRSESEQLRREEAERQLQIEARIKEELARRVREEVARKAREARIAQRLKLREAAERQAREEAERIAREEAAREAREAAELLVREAAEKQVREEAERIAREEAAREAREAAELLAREAAEKQAREEAERIAREEAAREARDEAERRAREAAERQAREEAERIAREEAAREAREVAERLAREAAEKQAREEAERIAREEAAREAREAAERLAREAAERQARDEAKRIAREEVARLAQEKSVRKAREGAEKIAGKAARRKIREEKGDFRGRMTAFLARLKWLAAGGLVLLLLVAAGIQFVPLSFARIPLEKRVSAKLGEPVEIQAVRVALLPSPYLRLEQLRIGSRGESHIADAALHFGWATLFGSDHKLERIELDHVDLAAGMLEKAVGWPEINARQEPVYQVGRITLRHLQIAAGGFTTPPLMGEFDFARSGGLDKAWLGREDRALRVDFSPSPEGLGVALGASEWTPFYFLPVKISSLHASAKVGDHRIVFTALEGSASGGKVSGALTLSWDSGWSASGEMRVAGANIVAPAANPESPVITGKLDASVAFSQHAQIPEHLFRPPLLSGSLTLHDGAVKGFDLSAALHYGVEAIYIGHTPFDTWSFRLEQAGDKQAYKAMRMAGKGLLIEGGGEVGVTGALSGIVKLAVEEKQATVRGNYALGGSLSRPAIRPLR